MPIYQYRCQKCDVTFELLHKTRPSDKWRPKCVECGSRFTDKEIANTTFRLGGKGWAKDGYSK